MNVWNVLGLMSGVAMVLLGAGLANGISLSPDTIKILGLCGVLMLGMAIGAYISRSSMRLALAATGAPLALIALVSMNPAGLSGAPIIALAQVSTAMERGNDGHFRATAEINNAGSVEMLVDTGASVVLLSHEHADILDIDMDALAFDVPVITANGRSHVALIKLDSLNVGGVTLSGIDAAVAQPGQLHSSLLGMSYLGALQEVVLRGNQMILRN